ncbi:MAG: hypothetical protein HOP08_20540 [Cyclobacteriaceae bacterium]|nr:hypothetical protein [Cyclobacteriaceae bacterium]
MEIPLVEEEKKKDSGCLLMLGKITLIIAGLFVLEYFVQWSFHREYPANELTKTFLPFQNNYLAFTDAFITSEGMTSAFSDDLSATGRLLGNGVLVIGVLAILSVIIFVIPFTKKYVDNILYWLYIPVFTVTLIYSQFFPPVKTVFDSEHKKMLVTTYSWMFIENTIEIPYDSISDFYYSLEDVNSYSDSEHAELAAIFAASGDQKIFIGENQTGTHAPTDSTWRIKARRQPQAKLLIESLKKITGVLIVPVDTMMMNPPVF